MKKLPLLILLAFAFACTNPKSDTAPLVFQSDFGIKDAAVASMRGVAAGISPDLKMYDLTHDIPAFNVWEAAQRLLQTAEYWPSGTVFVSVVDPGVGTERKSVVLKTESGHYFVTPDNGTLTLIAERLGIASIREIDEAVNRRKNSEKSYTFHGRDVYAYTGARLAAGIIDFSDVGPELEQKVVTIEYQRAKIEDNVLFGNIPILDIQYGNIWTNIDRATFKEMAIEHGQDVKVRISQGDRIVTQQTLPYQPTFGEVEIGKPLLYLNSLNHVSIALNQGSFAGKYHIGSGPDWNIEIWKADVSRGD